MEQELIEKVREYLISINLVPLNGTISYNGIRENAPQIDGTTRDMHIISFVVEFNNEGPFGNEICGIYVDVETEKLKVLVTPYYMNQIV